jgi:hypothetical protein
MSKFRIAKVQFKEHVEIGLSAIPEKSISPGKRAYDKSEISCEYDGRVLRIDYKDKNFHTLVPSENIASIMMEPVVESNPTQKGR